MKNRKWLKVILLLVILILIVIIALNWMEGRKPTAPKQVVNSTPALVEQGRYLVAAADCASCHTTQNGALYAGGYALDTVFGTIYSSNITPSSDFGIGRWTADDFYKSMTEGVSPIHRNLYPAMPYPYFVNIKREDSDAMYAYFMSIPAIDVPAPENKMSFPYNQRALMIGWNMLFLDKEPLPVVSTGLSDEWKRGEYLVNTLGHCAMCHTPMGEFGNIERDKMFEGNVAGRFMAPNLTPKGLSERGWDKASLTQFFSKGIAPQGSAFSDMYLVIHNSTSQLNAADVNAIATFLLGDNPPEPKVVVSKSEGLQGAGYDTYLTMCASCHNIDGTGKPNVSVSLVGNSTVMNPDSRNLIVAILDGLPWQTFPDEERLQSMPAFSTEMSNGEIAELVNFLRTQWGGLEGNVTAEQVGALHQ